MSDYDHLSRFLAAASSSSASAPPPQRRPRRVAFANSGNLCYLNSTIQALCSCGRFRELLCALAKMAAPVSEGGRGNRLPPRYSTLRCLEVLGREMLSVGANWSGAQPSPLLLS